MSPQSLKATQLIARVKKSPVVNKTARYALLVCVPVLLLAPLTAVRAADVCLRESGGDGDFAGSARTVTTSTVSPTITVTGWARPI
jgi:hypothetical protein